MVGREEIIQPRACLLWDNGEIAHIKMHYNYKSDETIAGTLGRSKNAVRDKRLELGLVRETRHMVAHKVKRMKELIRVCETSTSPYRLGLAKEELLVLSGLV